MDKKKLTIIIVVVVALALVGYGYNRWQQQRLARQLVQDIYGGRGLSERAANELAKQIAKDATNQQTDAAKEAAKTPQDRFNDTKETAIVGQVSPVFNDEAKPAVVSAFGAAKVVSYGTAYLGGSNGSFTASFKVPRAVTVDDLSKIAKQFEAKGYKVLTSSSESDSATITLMKGQTESLTLSYSSGGTNQIVEVTYLTFASQ